MIRVNDVNLTKFYLDMISLKFNKMQTVTRLKEIKQTVSVSTTYNARKRKGRKLTKTIYPVIYLP